MVPWLRGDKLQVSSRKLPALRSEGQREEVASPVQGHLVRGALPSAWSVGPHLISVTRVRPPRSVGVLHADREVIPHPGVGGGAR